MYNLGLLKEQCGNDKEFFNEMLDTFISSSLDGIEKMEAACLKNDLKEMGLYAHKIISPCRHISAEKLIPLLSEIEGGSRGNSFDQNRARFLIQQIKEEANGLVKALKNEYL